MIYQIVSLSGGKDSTAMLLMMLEHGERVDEVITVDTGMEFPAMYEHIQKLEEYTGIEFTKLKHEHSFEYFLFDYQLKKGERKGEHGYGWARPHSRWCTKTLKTSITDKYLSDLKREHEVVECIGIAADEPKRIHEKRYPLVEYGITEKQALEYCYQKGFTWGGLYEKFDRVSCWCCPLQRIDELRILRHDFPELWEKLMDMDKRSYNQFRIDYSIKQLDRRFAFEDAQLSLFSS